MSDQWQDISTAPKDGTVVDLYCRDIGRVAYCVWGEAVHGSHPGNQVWVRAGRRSDMVKCTPTHWMPLPSPPEARP